MILQFIKKEFLESISGPRFIITFAICAILILTSIYTGYELYKTEYSSYITSKNENIKALENSGGYQELKSKGSKTFREPSRMGIFVKGVDSSIGRASLVNDDPSFVIRDSRFGLNPVFAMFGELDLAFIVKIILSLFALLYSYNIISGERELGTLKLVMSYPASRASFVIGKTVGGLLTLLLTLIIPLLLGLLMLLFFFDVNFSVSEWSRIALMVLVFSLYLGVFYTIGAFMSAMTKNSFVSFLLALFVWVLCIVVLPKGAVELAGQVSPAPSPDVVESERAALTRNYYENYKALALKYFKEAQKTQSEPGEMNNAIDKAFTQARKEAEASRMEKEEPLIQAYERKQLKLLQTAEAFSRISPTSCLTLAANRLGTTDAELRNRFLESLRIFKEVYLKYADEQIRKNPDKRGGGVMVNINDSGMQMEVPDYKIELPGMPEFSIEEESVASVVEAIIPDILILTVFFLLLFAGTFIAFMRYDVR